MLMFGFVDYSYQLMKKKLVSYKNITLKLKAAENNKCFFCYNEIIDCVISPCGHQLCCFQHAQRLNATLTQERSLCSFRY